jgi:hypothetical protein
MVKFSSLHVHNQAWLTSRVCLFRSGLEHSLPSWLLLSCDNRKRHGQRCVARITLACLLDLLATNQGVDDVDSLPSGILLPLGHGSRQRKR